MTAPRPFVTHERVRWADVDLVSIMRFSAFTRLIEIAARNGGDPVMNPGLRTAIDNAKAESVPNANIDGHLSYMRKLADDAVSLK